MICLSFLFIIYRFAVAREALKLIKYLRRCLNNNNFLFKPHTVLIFSCKIKFNFLPNDFSFSFLFIVYRFGVARKALKTTKYLPKSLNNNNFLFKSRIVLILPYKIKFSLQFLRIFLFPFISLPRYTILKLLRNVFKKSRNLLYNHCESIPVLITKNI